MLVALSECSQEVPSPGGVPRRGGVGQESEKVCFLCKLSQGINKKLAAGGKHKGAGLFFC